MSKSARKRRISFGGFDASHLYSLAVENFCIDKKGRLVDPRGFDYRRHGVFARRRRGFYFGIGIGRRRFKFSVHPRGSGYRRHGVLHANKKEGVCVACLELKSRLEKFIGEKEAKAIQRQVKKYPN